MWFAVTANPVKRSRKQERKEFIAFSGEVVMSAETLAELQSKIQESKVSYPEQTKRYLEAGIKLVEARSSGEAKRRSTSVTFYFNDKDQYSFF